MTIIGSVPAANAGVVDLGNKIPGQGVGIFEATIVNGKDYVTQLTFKNVPVTITKGANAGFVGIEAYDFGAALMFLKGINLALTATESDTFLSGTALTVMMGTVTATDLVTPGATEKNVLPSVASTGGTYATVGKVIALNQRTLTVTTSGGAQLFDGTASATKFFVNINAIAANISATSKVVLNGTVEIHYTDCGSDLAVGV